VATPLLLLLVAAAAAPLAHAAVAARYDAWRARDNQGAYLGCYDSKSLQLTFSGAQSADACKDVCAGRRRPLYAVNRALQCTCFATIPAPAKLADEVCESGRSGAAAVFYIHSDKATSCSVQRQRLGWEGFDAAYNSHNAMFDGTGNGLNLRMEGSHGVRIASRQSQKYGMLSFKGRASGDPGVITAAYLRSDKHDSPNTYDEIGKGGCVMRLGRRARMRACVCGRGVDPD